MRTTSLQTSLFLVNLRVTALLGVTSFTWRTMQMEPGKQKLARWYLQVLTTLRCLSAHQWSHVIGFSSSRMAVVLTRVAYFVCGWDSGVLQTGTCAADAAVCRVSMGVMVFCLWPSALMTLISSQFQIIGVQAQLQWVLSCYGTILHLLFLHHLTWAAVVLAVALISSCYSVTISAYVGPVLFQVVPG